MTFAAVVVTHNRLSLLRELLNALAGQTYQIDELIVVDNASTDGTADVVSREHPNVTLILSGQNRGGAGGFALGVDFALARGHTAAWLMDDDAKPYPDAFAGLVEEWNRRDASPAFLASLVVDEAGQPLKTHNVEGDVGRLEGLTSEPVEVTWASFVGVLVNLELARKTWLPIGDFFILHDDVEYTSRLGCMGRGFVVPRSKIEHPDNSSIPFPTWRIYFEVRNRLWIGRSEVLASPRIRGVLGRRVIRDAVTMGRCAPEKWLFCRKAIRGLWDGLARRAEPQVAGTLVADPSVVPGKT